MRDSARPRRSNGKYELRRREIVEAAADVFRRKGYSDASIKDIADEVGMLKGSLYHYIETKEDLLFEVLTETYNLARENIDNVEAIPGLTPLERLDRYIREHIKFNATHTTKIAIYYHDFELVGPERKPFLVEQRKQFERYVADLIVKAQSAGEVDKRIDAKVSSFLILGAMNWAYTWFRPDGDMSAEELGDLAADLLLNGLRGASPTGHPAAVSSD